MAHPDGKTKISPDPCELLKVEIRQTEEHLWSIGKVGSDGKFVAEKDFLSLDSARDFHKRMLNSTIFWQTCPKCEGEGTHFPKGQSGQEPCPVCNGKMIISLLTGKPPTD